MIKDILDNYFSLESEIKEHFGFIEDWRIYPIVDEREQYWYIIDDVLKFSPDREGLEENDGETYSSEIVNNRVFEINGFTMVVVDMQCDGNILAFILDNSKEISVP